MSDMRSEGGTDASVPEPGTLAPACGTPYIKQGFMKIPVDDECLCGCRGDDYRCARWLAGDSKSPTHTCC